MATISAMSAILLTAVDLPVYSNEHDGARRLFMLYKSWDKPPSDEGGGKTVGFDGGRDCERIQQS